MFNVPVWLEPYVIAFWSFFFLFWGPGRRGVMHNLRAIKPGSTALGNFFRTYRVFWNYAWTITETGRFRELGIMPDWEFEGLEHFEALQSHPGGAIMLTAHMGSYDLGAQLFASRATRPIVMVRAPEVDPQTHQFEETHGRHGVDGLHVDFNTRANVLALDLLHALRDGKLLAIQGDRVTPGIAAAKAPLFGRMTSLPSGPFALAIAARVPLFPVFIVRAGRRHYRVVTCEPIVVERRSRNRNEDLQRAVEQWARQLEKVIAAGWHQWFAFDPFDAEAAA